jgi:acetyl esterase
MIAMPAHPQVRTFLDLVNAAGGPPMRDIGPEQAREMFNAMYVLFAPGEDVGSVEDLVVPAEHGGVPARLYRPEGPGPHAALIWLHGGGWVIGDLDTSDATARALCNRSGAAVISLDYRLAPEARFPAAADDCLAAVRWVDEHASDLGIDAGRMAIGGDSAGGNLSAVTALRLRDEGGPALRFQLLVYPVTDCTASQPSYEENADGYLLTRDTMLWFIDCYVADGDQKHPHVSPLHAEDVSGLPPALVITAELDPLRDEGEAYAARLRDAGVTTELVRYDGEIHGFFAMLGVLDDATAAVDRAGAALRAALG